MKALPELQIQLHFDDFGKGKPGADFTFIPYGLESNLSKEAVKVHVLHGRNRGRNTGKPRSRQKPGGVMHGQVFEWDSKPVSGPKVQKIRDGGEDEGRQTATFVAKPRSMRHYICKTDQGLSMDHAVLRNPFVDRIRTDLGRVSSVRVESLNYIVDHCTFLVPL